MNLLKLLLKIVISLLGIVLLAVLIIIWVDASQTDYLEIKKEASTSTDSLLITNVHVIPMDRDTVLANKIVYIKSGVIVKIADTIAGKHTNILDAKGKYLSPGLIDMHVHVWDRYELGLYLSNGVTAVRNLWGAPMHLRIKEDEQNNRLLSPVFFTTGPKLTGPEFIGDDNLNLTDPTEAKKKVISYKEKGYDFIKTYYGLDQHLFDAVIEQAAASEMDIVAHPSQKVPFLYHLNPQIRSIEHAEEIVQQPLQFDLDTVKLQPLTDAIGQSHHTGYCPTLTVFNNIYQMMMNDSILDSPALGYMNPLIRQVDSSNEFERWHNAKRNDPGTAGRIKAQHDFHLTIVRKLHDAGVNIICGTDAGIGVTLPGFSIHRELAFYKAAGLSNYEVLKTATVNASRTHDVMNAMGTVAPGKMANLLLLEGNPLSDLSYLENPYSVIIKGRVLNRATLETFKEKARNRKNLVVTALRYFENLMIEK